MEHGTLNLHNRRVCGHRRNAAGFTLIELLLVISLISLMLFFAIPRFEGGFLADASRRSSILLIQTMERLKQRAVEEKTDYALHLNLDTHHFWITTETMDEEQRLEAQREGTDLSDALYLEDVEFPRQEKALYGEVSLFFYRKGYSDRARIHLQLEDGRQATLFLESFLPEVRITNEYVSFPG